MSAAQRAELLKISHATVLVGQRSHPRELRETVNDHQHPLVALHWSLLHVNQIDLQQGREKPLMLSHTCMWSHGPSLGMGTTGALFSFGRSRLQTAHASV